MSQVRAEPTGAPTSGLWTRARMERRLRGELDDRPAVHLKHLRAAGLDGIDLSVKRGEVFGLLGPEGAGKTALVRVMMDLVRPDAGQAFLLGLDTRIRAAELRDRVGYLPQGAPLPGHLRADRLLATAARRHGVSMDRAHDLARRLHLDTGQRVGEMGRADRQKTAIVLAFLHDPDLLVLDEPTAGLPAADQQEFLRMVLEARATGATVFYASHVVSEVEKVCDRIGVLHDGRLHAHGTLSQWARQVRRALIVTFDRPPVPGAFDGVDGLALAEANGDRVRFVMDGPIDPLIKALGAHTVLDLSTDDAELEATVLAGGMRG